MEQCAVMSGREPEERIIEACQQGDREALRQLFMAYKDRVYSIALYFFGGDEAAAHDVTQQVFLKIMTRVSQFRREAEFTTWLYRLTVNACIDEQRRARRFLPFADLFGAARGAKQEKSSQEEEYLRIEIEEAVRQAVAELKPKLMLPILLKYVQGMTYEEMGRVLNCSAVTIASRLNRGHKILARRLSYLRRGASSG